MPDLEELEKKIGVTFSNKDLLLEALTHRSYLNERPSWRLPHNERLEFLGDAVLELATSEALFRKFPESPEGQMTMLRAALVNYQILSRIAADLKLSSFILMSKGENRDTGRARDVILANAIEAVIGSIYLDQGYQVAERFIDRYVLVHLDEILTTRSYKDAKSELQEIVQERLKTTPTYRVLGESGPAHQRVFTIGVYFGDELIAQGTGASKQEGETQAARKALEQYKG